MSAVAETLQSPACMTVKNLDFYYGKYKAIKNVNMEIAKNKVTAFIGPSGCGKSTLLRIFNRMFELYPEQRAEGEILLDGQNILTSKEDVSLVRAKIGMVFQKPTPFPMSIYDNIAFGIKLYEKLPKSELDDRVEWALTKTALWGEVKDKAVLAKDVRTVLAYVETGNVEAGIVYKTDAASSAKVKVAAAAPEGSHQPIVYPVAILSGTKQQKAAEDFLAFLRAPENKPVFEKYGFVMANQ